MSPPLKHSSTATTWRYMNLTWLSDTHLVVDDILNTEMAQIEWKKKRCVLSSELLQLIFGVQLAYFKVNMEITGDGIVTKRMHASSLFIYFLEIFYFRPNIQYIYVLSWNKRGAHAITLQYKRGLECCQ